MPISPIPVGFGGSEHALVVLRQEFESRLLPSVLGSWLLWPPAGFTLGCGGYRRLLVRMLIVLG